MDAASGSVALTFDTIEHAKNRSVCDANNTAAQYPCTAPVWTEGVTPAGQDGDVGAAYNFAGDTYDFFFTRFGRDSLRLLDDRRSAGAEASALCRFPAWAA